MNHLPRSIREAAELLRARKASAVELADLALARSHADRHNAWLHLSDDHARAQARLADARLAAGDAALLTGIPWACKDIIGTKAIPTTAGSRILEGYVPAYSATVVDQLGPFANTVEDVAIVCEAIFGKDPNDATMVTDLPNDDLRRDLDKGVKGMRLGVPKEYFSVKGMEPGVERAVRDALKVLEREGAKLEEVSLSLTDHGLAVYYIIQPAEASSNLARYDGIRYGLRVEGPDLLETYRRTRGKGFGPEVKRRMILGTYALSAGYYDAYYVKAQKVRTLIKAEYDRVFETVDALVTPTSPTVAFAIGAKVNEPLAMYLNDVFTLPVNIAGLPGISVPCGLSEGLPVGLQIIANSYQERTMFRVAAAYERATPHHLARPAKAAA